MPLTPFAGCRPRVAWLPVSCLALAAPPVSAHEIVGNRFFPATLGIDDPGVNDELSLPTYDSLKTGGLPPIRQQDFSGEYSKRITDNFGISVGAAYTRLSSTAGFPGMSAQGWQNVETTFKYRLVRDAAREFVLSVGLGIEWGGTGSTSIGAERFNVYTPTVYFGKGFGDLPDTMSLLRPFAVTGQVGYAIPGRRSATTWSFDPDSGLAGADVEIHPDVLYWGGTIQYSMPYLKSAVRDYGLPDFINRLVPIVEATLATPVASTLSSGTVTTGTINPGVLWIGKGYQLGVEALIPINRQSGSGTGVIAQLHFYLDDLMPDTLGRPIFATANPVMQGRARP